MSNKVTNIYIDTTGFCDEAMVRVNKALGAIVEHNGMESIQPSNVAAAKGNTAVYFDRTGVWFYANRDSEMLDGRKSSALWELESIAFRCKQEKEEGPLPTRNIYIDARKLTQAERKSAFSAIKSLMVEDCDGWFPHFLASTGSDVDFVLYDLFAIDGNGRRVFLSDIYAGLDFYLDDPKELTYNQLMSLTR